MMRRARLHFWLHAMDVANALGCFGAPRDSRRFALYLWCVGKASDATDWGPPC